MIKADKLPFHYGWIVVLACGVGMFVTFPQVYTVPGIYVVPITEDLGITRTAHSFSVTLLVMASAVAASMVGRLLRRLPARAVMTGAAVVLGLNLMSYSVLGSLAGLYIRAVISGAAICLAGNITMTILLQRWFVKSVNFAMSLAFTCTGLGGMVFSQVLSRVLLEYGWRSCYFVSGITVMLAVVPAYFFLIKDSPEKVGLLPFGSKSLEGVAVEKPRAVGVTLKEAARHWYFYAFMLSVMAVSIASGCTQSHFPPSLYDSGYALATVAAIQSVYSMLNSITKLSVGIIFDKIGARAGLFIVIMGYAAGYIALAFAGLGHMLGYMAGIGFGIGIAWATLGIPFVIANIFGGRDYANIYGFCAMMSQMASALATTCAGLFYDIVGSYFMIWLAFSLGCVLAFTCFMLGLSRDFFKTRAPAVSREA